MKKLSLLSGLFLFISLAFVYAQDEDNIQLNFYDGEFFLAEEEYRDALLAFQKVYNAGYEDNANINYRIGICYLNLPGEKEKAIPYLEKAVTSVSDNYREGSLNETDADLDAWLFLGNAYRIDNLLDKSCNAYKKYIEITDNPDSKEVSFARKQIEACERAKKAMDYPAEIQKESLGPLYNSSFNNFNPVLSMNENAMAYMSEQRFYDAVFFMEIENGRFSNPINITPQIQSDGDQYVTSLSRDGTKMLLSKISSFDADIMISDYEARRWTRSRNIGKPINTKFFESHACFSPDGNTIYFTSNRRESLGGMDIFVSTLNEDGNWTEPLNLGETVNTDLNEETPFICEDGKTLFFSSQGHTSIGGYDIFVTRLQDDGTWTEPEPLPYPMNTTDDDLFFYPLCDDIVEDDISGYMSRIEPEGLGSGDIYKMTVIPYEEITEEEVEEEIEEVVEEEAEETVVEVEPEPREEPVEEVVEEQVEEKEEVEEVEEVIEQPVYTLKPIYFAFDSYELSSTAESRLDKLAETMKSYKEIKVELQGHADAMGPEVYNQYLSEKRAESAKDYLLARGISEERISTKGFSELEPVAINTNPDGSDSFRGRKLNRRVEYEIDPGIKETIIIEEVEVPEDLRIKE